MSDYNPKRVQPIDLEDMRKFAQDEFDEIARALESLSLQVQGATGWPGEAADYNWTGRHIWDQALTVKGQFPLGGQTIDLYGFDVSGTYIPIIAQTRTTEAPNDFGVVIGYNDNFSAFGYGGLLLNAGFDPGGDAQPIEMAGDLVWPVLGSAKPAGIRFRDATGAPVIQPAAIPNSIVRFDEYTSAQLDLPPGIGNSFAATMTWHGDNATVGNDQFAFQYVIGTAGDYDQATTPVADPVIAIRSGAPLPTNDWNGDWLNLVVADVNGVDGSLPRWNGASIIFDQDQGPGNGRFVGLEACIAQMWADPTETPFTQTAGNILKFSNALPTQTAVYPIGTDIAQANSFSGIFVVYEPGLYLVSINVLCEIGVGAETSLTLYYKDGAAAEVAVPPASLVMSTAGGGQGNVYDSASSQAWVVIPVTDTGAGTQLYWRINAGSNSITDLAAGQFWLKREY